MASMVTIIRNRRDVVVFRSSDVILLRSGVVVWSSETEVVRTSCSVGNDMVVSEDGSLALKVQQGHNTTSRDMSVCC